MIPTLLQVAQPETITGLTVGGWVTMLSSIALVCGLAGFCIIKILREAHPKNHHHTPLDIDTQDTDN